MDIARCRRWVLRRRRRRYRHRRLRRHRRYTLLIEEVPEGRRGGPFSFKPHITRVGQSTGKKACLPGELQRVFSKRSDWRRLALPCGYHRCVFSPRRWRGDKCITKRATRGGGARERH
tara:strand:+ start:60914 stop:61267 length:354 start_codon:yes stop_codon:yes gene_type:complete